MAKAKNQRLVKRFDKDGDGKLSDDEKAGVQADRKKSKAKDSGKKVLDKAKDKDDEKAGGANNWRCGLVRRSSCLTTPQYRS